MNEIIEKLDLLSKNRNITLYRNPDTKKLYSGVGKVPGEFNKQLLDLLKYTNGAGIMDYCLLGFKNPRLGTSIDKFLMELWPSNNLLAGIFIGFMLDNIGGTFGYLFGNDCNFLESNPIAYSKNDEPDKLYIIGSSFNSFFLNFLDDIVYTISENSEDDLLISVEIEEWPTSVEHWLKRDNKLEDTHKKLNIEKDGVLIL